VAHLRRSALSLSRLQLVAMEVGILLIAEYKDDFELAEVEAQCIQLLQALHARCGGAVLAMLLGCNSHRAQSVSKPQSSQVARTAP